MAAIPAKLLVRLASDLGPHLGALNPPPFKDLRLAESLELWTLPGDWHRGWSAAPTLQQVAETTHRLHHQLRLDGSPWAYVRTTQERAGEGGARWNIEEVSISDLATEVDQGLRVIEDEIHDSPEIRLLDSPEFQLYVLWAANGADPDRVVVIDQARNHLNIPAMKVLPAEELMRTLDRHYGRAIRGVS